MIDLEDRKITVERLPIDELKDFEEIKKSKKAYWKMINEKQKKGRTIDQKKIYTYELWKNHHSKLPKKERKQLIAEMILYCSPKVVWVQKRNSKQSELRNEKEKMYHIKTCTSSLDNERSI